ncbi:methyltransferase [Nonomuraea sp. NPDC050790]|uniref:methyltransferase n=1 Tax=Nonomuraea sp. NPDC050790 TaxID=3364371 RepID=UPI00379D5242
MSMETAVYGLVATPALHLAIRHDLSGHLLDHGPSTAAQVAAARRLDADAVERVLLVLAAFGLLTRDAAGRFLVVPDARPYLTKGGPDYVGGFVEHLMTETLARLPALDDHLREGRKAAGAYAGFYRDERATRDFVSAMWGLSFGVSHELAELLDLSGHRRLVDVGGANGPFSVAALRRAPALTATVFDLEQVRPPLEESRRRHGLESRLDFTAGGPVPSPRPS